MVVVFFFLTVGKNDGSVHGKKYFNWWVCLICVPLSILTSLNTLLKITDLRDWEEDCVTESTKLLFSVSHNMVSWFVQVVSLAEESIAPS